MFGLQKCMCNLIDPLAFDQNDEYERRTKSDPRCCNIGSVFRLDQCNSKTYCFLCNVRYLITFVR